MSLVPVEERRVFVREAAAQLAAASSVTLTTESAAGLSEICQTLMSKAEKIGAHTIAQFMGESKNLCALVLKNTTPTLAAEADEVLKSSFAAVRSALFNMALGDVADASSGQFDRLEARICELTCENIADSPVVEAVPNAPADSWDDISRVTSESLPPSFVPPSSKFTPTEQLLRSIAKLAEKTQSDGELREMAFEVASAARAAHSFRFAMVCRNVETDTPDALLDETHARTVREQLSRWQKQGSDVKSVATLRQVGGALWLELRQKFEGIYPSRSKQEEEGNVQGVSAEEDYVTVDKTWIRRARLELLLPTFKAYEISFGGRIFLFPVGDIESVFDAPPAELDCMKLSNLFDLPDDWQSQSEISAAIVVRWRGKSTVVEVDSVEGPKTFLARNVYDAGPNMRGVVGVARLSDGKRAAVIDLYPWFETYTARAEEQKQEEKIRQVVSGKYLVFRVSGKRYAVPVTAVKTVGRVDNESLLIGMVETKQGTFHLRDIKESLGLEGEAGAVFLVIDSSGGAIAWIVDGIEKVHVLAPEYGEAGVKLRLAPFGYSHHGGKVQGLIRGVLPNSQIPLGEVSGGSVPSAPIYLIDVDALRPTGRPLRRFA